MMNMITDKTNKTIGEIAGFWRRAGALLIDILIINIIIVSQFSNALSKYFNEFTLADGINSKISIPTNVYIIIFVISVLALLYFTFFEYYLGQTVGDMLMKIRTTSLKSNLDLNVGKTRNSDKYEESNISLWKAAIRNCYILPFFPFYILWIIEPMYLAFYKERFLERITNTRTICYSNDSTYKNKYKEYKLEKV